MRIIAGSQKGRLLKTPKNNKIIRPALAQVREAIFSSLGDVTDKIFFDVFAGTGSLGFEALSRGAPFCYFIDVNAEALNLILTNLKNLNFSKQARVFKRRLPSGLKNIKITHPVDVIFCDPPYDKNLLNPTLAILVKQDYIKSETMILTEHTRREGPVAPNGWEVFKQKRFGQTYLSYLRKV